VRDIRIEHFLEFKRLFAQRSTFMRNPCTGLPSIFYTAAHALLNSNFLEIHGKSDKLNRLGGRNMSGTLLELLFAGLFILVGLGFFIRGTDRGTGKIKFIGIEMSGVSSLLIITLGVGLLIHAATYSSSSCIILCQDQSHTPNYKPNIDFDNTPNSADTHTTPNQLKNQKIIK